MPGQPQLLTAKPGIRRDGTRLYGGEYNDGQWVRFIDGRPIKIGGYSVITPKLGAISRGLHSASIDGVTYIHSGGTDRLELVTINRDGTISAPAARTPVGLTVDATNVWSFAAIQDVIAGTWQLVAHVAPNGQNIDSTTTGTVYIGKLNDTAALTAVQSAGSPFKVAGGCLAVHPFMFYFGNAGDVIWSVSNKPGDVDTVVNAGTNIAAGEARVTGAKIVAGRRLLGAGVPGALLWSLDTLVRASYIGGSATWDFDPVATIEILAAKSVVEYNGAYFWIGAGRFQAFNGQTVIDVPNEMNRRWFFAQLNRAQTAKVFGFTVPSCGEIWWCFPRGAATECNHAIVLQVATGVWYDTPLPNGGRSAALGPTTTYPYPVMAGVDAVSNGYHLWQHETGVDEVDGRAGTKAVRSYFITNDLTLLRGQQPSNAAIEALDIELDFNQTGDLTLTVIGNQNARAPDEISDPVTIPDPANALAPASQVIELKEERRQMRFKFESNTLGGSYEAGENYLHLQPAGQRTRS